MPFRKKRFRDAHNGGHRLRELSGVYDRYAPYSYALALKLTGKEDASCLVVREVFRHIWHEHFEGSMVAIPVSLPDVLLLTRRVALGRMAQIPAENETIKSNPYKERRTDLKPVQALNLFLLEGMSADEIAMKYQTGVTHIEALITAALQEVRNCTD